MRLTRLPRFFTIICSSVSRVGLKRSVYAQGGCVRGVLVKQLSAELARLVLLFKQWEIYEQSVVLRVTLDTRSELIG